MDAINGAGLNSLDTENLDVLELSTFSREFSMHRKSLAYNKIH